MKEGKLNLPNHCAVRATVSVIEWVINYSKETFVTSIDPEGFFRYHKENDSYQYYQKIPVGIEIVEEDVFFKYVGHDTIFQLIDRKDLQFIHDGVCKKWQHIIHKLAGESPFSTIIKVPDGLIAKGFNEAGPDQIRILEKYLVNPNNPYCFINNIGDQQEETLTKAIKILFRSEVVPTGHMPITIIRNSASKPEHACKGFLIHNNIEVVCNKVDNGTELIFLTKSKTV